MFASRSQCHNAHARNEDLGLCRVYCSAPRGGTSYWLRTCDCKEELLLRTALGPCLPNRAQPTGPHLPPAHGPTARRERRRRRARSASSRASNLARSHGPELGPECALVPPARSGERVLAAAKTKEASSVDAGKE